MQDLCDTGRIPTIEEYCDFRKNGVAYASDVKPQVIELIIIVIDLISSSTSGQYVTTSGP